MANGVNAGNTRRYGYKGLLLLCLGVLLSACSHQAANPPVAGAARALDVVIRAKNDSNPNSQQQAQPVKLRVYQLRTPLGFYQADFMALRRQDSKLLGDELISLDNLPPLKPGGSLEHRLNLHPEAAFVAVYAEFEQFRNAKYKQVLELKPRKPSQKHWVLRLEANRLTEE